MAGAKIQDRRLFRRTHTVNESGKRHLPENSFWTQVQHILAHEIGKEEYDERFYIDVHLTAGNFQSDEIRQFLANPFEPRCLLLVGSPGVGKTSLVEHYRNSVAGRSNGPWAWIYFNGNDFRDWLANDKSQLIPCLLANCVAHLDRFLKRYGLTREDYLLDIFEHDRGLEERRFLRPDISRADKLRSATIHLEKKESVHLAAILRYFARFVAAGRAVLILDNLDPLGAELQAEAVRQVLALSVGCKIKSIVAVRQDAEAILSYSDPELFSQFLSTRVQPPPLAEVLEKRVRVAIQHPDVQDAKLGEGALQFRVRDCPEFEKVIARGVSAEGLQRIFEGVSNDSVRLALRISLSVYASPHLEARRIVAKLSPVGQLVRDLWRDTIPNYIVVRSILLRTAKLYEEDHAWVKNIFGTSSSDTHVGPFLRLHILRFLVRLGGEEVQEADLIADVADALMIEGDFIQKEIKWMAKKHWVAALPSGALSLTGLGSYLANDFGRFTVLCG
jgi:AAA ATPase domain